MRRSSDSLKQEKIVGSADMTPALIAKEAQQAGLKNVDLPTVSVAGKAIDNGAAGTRLRELHAHPRPRGDGWLHVRRRWAASRPSRTPEVRAAVGGGTDNPQFAAVDAKTNQPVANGARDIWVTETALATALNTSFMADRLGLFGIVVGVALFLSGIGFIILAFAALHRKQTKLSAA